MKIQMCWMEILWYHFWAFDSKKDAFDLVDLVYELKSKVEDLEKENIKLKEVINFSKILEDNINKKPWTKK